MEFQTQPHWCVWISSGQQWSSTAQKKKIHDIQTLVRRYSHCFCFVLEWDVLTIRKIRHVISHILTNTWNKGALLYSGGWPGEETLQKVGRPSCCRQQEKQKICLLSIKVMFLFERKKKVSDSERWTHNWDSFYEKTFLILLISGP